MKKRLMSAISILLLGVLLFANCLNTNTNLVQIGNTEVPLTANEDSSDIFGMTNFANWRTGNYSLSGKYSKNTARICLNDYVSVVGGQIYIANISNTNLHILVRELDSNNKFIKSYDLADKDTFTVSASCAKLGISMYDTKLKVKTFEMFKTLFQEGFKATLTLSGNSQQDQVVEEDNNIVSATDKNDVFAMTNFVNWRTGNYSYSNGLYSKDAARICLKDYVSVVAGQEYIANISNTNLHILVRELDSNNKFIKSYDLADKDTFTVSASCAKLGISMYDTKLKVKTFEMFKTLFQEGFKATLTLSGNSQQDQVVEEDNNIVSATDKNDVFAMTNFVNWRTGNYSYSNGLYSKDAARICLKDYSSVSSNQKYTASISNTNYHILVREMDKDGKFIKSYNLADKGTFTVSSSCVKIGISIYDTKSKTTSFDMYKELFQNGFKAMLILESNTQDDIVLEEETPIYGSSDDKDQVVIPTERIDSKNEIDIFDMLASDNWIEGTYLPNGAKIKNDSSKIRLKYMVDVNVGDVYTVNVSDTSFRVLIKAIDENGLIRGVYNMSNGDTLPIELGIIKLAISAYDSSNTDTNYEAYRNALNNGLKLYMTLTPSKYTEGEKNVINELLNLVNVGSTDSKNVLSYKVSFSSFYNTIFPDLKNNMAYLNYQSCDKFQTTSSISGNYISTVAWKNYNSDYNNRLIKMKHSINEFLATVDDNMSDTEKVLLAHEYIVNKAYYKDSGDVRFCASGILADGYGVCESYAEALGVLLHYMGIEYDLVISNSMNHEWLMVYLDGQWYHIDPTWDDTRAGENIKYQHRFLLKNDNEFTQVSSNRHYSWIVYERYGTTSKSESYSNWFVHDVAGSMYYYNGMWYYSDDANNSIYKSDINGGNKSLVYQGSSIIRIKGISSGVLTYIEGNCTKSIKL